MKKLKLIIGIFYTLFAQAQAIEVQSHTAGEAGFLVNSHLLLGAKEAVLIDAQFTRSEAKKVSKLIKESGRKLKTIFITHGHPDHYFGLEILVQDFPDAQILARSEVIKDIELTGSGKQQYWKAIYKEDLTDKIILPQAFTGSELNIENEKIVLVDMGVGESEHSTVIYLPSLNTVISGDVLYNRVHLWLAENRPEAWIKNLQGLKTLGANQFLPGHGTKGDASLVIENENYIKNFLEVTKGTKDSKVVQGKMLKGYPDYQLPIILELSVEARLK